MARTWAESQKLSRDDWAREYDNAAKSVGVESISFIREAIFQIDLARQGDRMEKMTRQMRTLTWWIAGLTVINTAGVIVGVVLDH